MDASNITNGTSNIALGLINRVDISPKQWLANGVDDDVCAAIIS